MPVSAPLAIDRLLEPAEATAIIQSHTPLLPTGRAALTDLAGRVLREDVISDEDQPPFPAATMDGYAVVSGDDATLRRIVGSQFAGAVETFHVEPGTAAYITTGAPLPPGADAVVQVEKTERAGDHVRIADTPRTGQNIRPVGSDLKRGDRVL